LIHFIKRLFFNVYNMTDKDVSEMLSTLDLSTDETRKEIPPEKIKKLLAVLELEELEIRHTLDCLRALRVLAAGSTENANLVLDFIHTSLDFQVTLRRYLQSSEILLPRILLQVIANSVNQNVAVRAELRRKLVESADMIYTDCVDAKVRNLTSCIVLKLMKSCEEDYSRFRAFVPAWLLLVKDEVEHYEFGLLCLKELLSHQWCQGLEQRQKDDIYNLLPELDLDPDGLTEAGLHGLVDSFTYLTDTILTTTLGSVEDLNPDVVMSLLEMIIKLSKSPRQNAVLQGKQSLLINTVYLLRMVHEAGKQGVQSFVPLGKLKDIEKQDQLQLENESVYGFKGKLIQLLVNLVWNHQENKSLVGELEGVQLLLDCSQLDAKNPLITQWVIMSIKALCDNHPDNQSVLLGLRRQGAADEDLIKELGIKLPPPKTTPSA